MSERYRYVQYWHARDSGTEIRRGVSIAAGVLSAVDEGLVRRGQYAQAHADAITTLTTCVPDVDELSVKLKLALNALR